jgi:hypothetical protein
MFNSKGEVVPAGDSDKVTLIANPGDRIPAQYGVAYDSYVAGGSKAKKAAPANKAVQPGENK